MDNTREILAKLAKQVAGLEQQLIKLTVVDLCEEGHRPKKHISLDEMQCAMCKAGKQIPNDRKFVCFNPSSDFYGRTNGGVRLDKTCDYYIERRPTKPANSG